MPQLLYQHDNGAISLIAAKISDDIKAAGAGEIMGGILFRNSARIFNWVQLRLVLIKCVFLESTQIKMMI